MRGTEPLALPVITVIRRMSMKRTFAGFLFSVALLSSALFAHHSGSWADSEHPITLTGTVTEFTFTNPHVLMTLAVKGQNGAVDKWVVEFNSPQSVRRSGLNAVT